MWGGIHGFSPPVVRERFAHFYVMLERKSHEIRIFPVVFNYQVSRSDNSSTLTNQRIFQVLVKGGS